jgi:CBS domain-containing protein
MRAREVMTPRPACCTPDDTARDVATVMRDRDCGCVPIIDQSTAKLLGMVTDRDLAVRGVAIGASPDTRIGDLMTASPLCCTEMDHLDKVERLMSIHQVRRMPVVDADGCCVGIIAQADLARAAQDGRRVTEHELAIVVERISAQNRNSVGSGANVRTLNAH